MAAAMTARDIRLTPTSYVVLGLIEAMGSATPYDLKLAARRGVSNLWALPHTQLYSESSRLAEAGLLSERREEGGRRRRTYSLTAAGRAALEDWRRDPVPPSWELRDAGLLKLFFGTDPAALAEAQLGAHRERLAEYEELREAGAESLPAGMRLALDAGIGHEREYLRFWQAVADGDTP
jgi:DNA-binding PadR family transcriptional regulator